MKDGEPLKVIINPNFPLWRKNMNPPLTQGAYNLLDVNWIPVLYGNGKNERVGICQALTDARSIRLIAASNPLDRVALSRFLLATLMWLKEDVKSSLEALDEKNSNIPVSWLTKLNDNRDAFNLLGDGQRFYQDKSLKGGKYPIGLLLGEFPGADSVNHARHVEHNGSYGFCPACCAMGILRFSVWAPANAYYPSSVNPASAAYAFVEGKNLFQSFIANLPETNPQIDLAPWLVVGQPNSPDAVTRLAWRPRKLWLNTGSENGYCENCGNFGELIFDMRFEAGWSTPTTSGQDFSKAVEKEFQELGSLTNVQKKVVKLATLISKCRMADLRKACCLSVPQSQTSTPTTMTDAREIARLFHQLILRDDESSQKAIKDLTKKPTEAELSDLEDEDLQKKKFWSSDPHLLREAEAIFLPKLDEGVAEHSKFWRQVLNLLREWPEMDGKVTAIGPVVNKFIFQDAVAITLPNASDTIKKLAKLSEAFYGNYLPNLFKSLAGSLQWRNSKNVEEFIKLLTPNVEAQIRERLSRIKASTDANATEASFFLREAYAPILEQVIASVTPGSPLRRRITRNRARYFFKKKIDELVENPDGLLSPDSSSIASGNQNVGE
jgi:hypothetical protein